MALRVQKDNFVDEVLNSGLPVLVDFYSESCVPCKQLSVILGDLEEEYENQIKIVKVNVNFSGELAEEYGVTASPTLLFFKAKNEVQRITGVTKKNVLKEIIDKII